MPRWIGFLGSWALLVLALGLTAFAVAGETINIRDLHRLGRVAVIDQMIATRFEDKAGALRQSAAQHASEINALRNKVASVEERTDDAPDTGQTILVSTEEHKVYMRRNGATVFEAPCATGKGTQLDAEGRTWLFDTPIGKFHVRSKDENPMWVPPDWYYVEEARKNGLHVVHLNPGGAIDARTGDPSSGRSEGVWSWFSGNSDPVLRVKGDTVVEDDGGSQRELPAGKPIIAGNAIVVPPLNTKQRHYKGVLGQYRLDLGDGYGIHGTDEPDSIGNSVSHGCVRLGDEDIARLYAMANVGDTVIIY
ncbi:MAG TPA: L,D-transpeptidase [Thermoanaerobaculia bacterium]|jgi:lipoprotein-anchoring transpeptidase ErfK/SrfK|nr:L,D-transpeptidase [Thermoanaerobaculia bacterium]